MRFAVSKTASGAKLKLQTAGQEQTDAQDGKLLLLACRRKDPTGPRTIAMQGQRG